MQKTKTSSQISLIPLFCFLIFFAVFYKVMTFSRYQRLSFKLLITCASNIAFSRNRTLKNSAIRLLLLNSVHANNREFIFNTVSISIIIARVLYEIAANCLFVT